MRDREHAALGALPPTGSAGGPGWLLHTYLWPHCWLADSKLGEFRGHVSGVKRGQQKRRVPGSRGHSCRLLCWGIAAVPGSELGTGCLFSKVKKKEKKKDQQKHKVRWGRGHWCNKPTVLHKRKHRNHVKLSVDIIVASAFWSHWAWWCFSIKIKIAAFKDILVTKYPSALSLTLTRADPCFSSKVHIDSENG